MVEVLATNLLSHWLGIEPAPPACQVDTLLSLTHVYSLRWYVPTVLSNTPVDLCLRLPTLYSVLSIQLLYQCHSWGLAYCLLMINWQQWITMVLSRLTALVYNCCAITQLYLFIHYECNSQVLQIGLMTSTLLTNGWIWEN